MKIPRISKLGKILIDSEDSDKIMNIIRNLKKESKTEIIYLSKSTIKSIQDLVDKK